MTPEDRTKLRELAPCPFCGGPARLENYIVEAVVRCARCGAKMLRSHNAHEDTGIPAAIAAWNRRAPAASPDRIIGLLEEVERLRKQVGALSRCLLPVWMGMAEAELVDEPVPDAGVVLSFMGSGASDQVTAGEIRAALSPGAPDQ